MPTKKSIPNIKVVVGKTFDIILQTQSGTGFSWCLAGMSNCLTLVGKQVTPIHPGLPGGSVREIFTFAGTSVGQGDLAFSLIRPWDPTHVADSKFYSVEVVSKSMSDELEESLGSSKFVSGTGQMSHSHPELPYGFPKTVADECGNPRIYPLYAYPPVSEYGFPDCSDSGTIRPLYAFPDCQSGATGPAVVHTSDASKCVVKYGFPGGVALDAADCNLKYGFPVDGEEKLNNVILKYGFPNAVKKADSESNCVVKYGTPSGISTDAQKCTLKYGIPVVKYGIPNCKE